MADRERYTTEEGRLGFRKTSGLKEDLKDIVKGVSRIMSPAALKERANVVEDTVDDTHSRQNTDRHNRY